MAEKMLKVPSVTMNGGSLSRVTRSPLSEPAGDPDRDPDQQGQHAGYTVVCGQVGHHQHGQDADRARPTGRCPAVRMIKVWPMANAAITAVCWMMIEIVAGWMNRGLMMVKTMTDDDQHHQRAEGRVGVQQVLDALHGRLAAAWRTAQPQSPARGCRRSCGLPCRRSNANRDGQLSPAGSGRPAEPADRSTGYFSPQQSSLPSAVVDALHAVDRLVGHQRHAGVDRSPARGCSAASLPVAAILAIVSTPSLAILSGYCCEVAPMTAALRPR